MHLLSMLDTFGRVTPGYTKSPPGDTPTLPQSDGESPARDTPTLLSITWILLSRIHRSVPQKVYIILLPPTNMSPVHSICPQSMTCLN